MDVSFMMWIERMIVREWLEFGKGIGMNGCKFYDVDRGNDS